MPAVIVQPVLNTPVYWSGYTYSGKADTILWHYQETPKGLSHNHHHHHLSLNHEGRWGNTDDFTTSFLHFSLFSLPSGTWQTPGLSSPWCCLPTSFSVCLVFFPLSLCLARWFWPDLIIRQMFQIPYRSVPSLRATPIVKCKPQRKKNEQREKKIFRKYQRRLKVKQMW